MHTWRSFDDLAIHDQLDGNFALQTFCTSLGGKGYIHLKT
jgi:hypothetical protein